MRVARLPARPLSAVAILLLMASIAAACSGGSAPVAGPGERAMGAVSTAPSPEPSFDPPIDPDIGINNITHVIVIVQENRSFDHYFGTFPGADGFPRDANGHDRRLRSRSGGRPLPAAVPRHEPVRRRRPPRAGRLGHLRERRADGRVRAGVGADRQRLRAPSRRLPVPAGPTRARRDSPTSWGTTPPRRSRTTGRTRSTSSCRTTCSRRSRRGRCPRTCSWCRRGPRRARISATP